MYFLSFCFQRMYLFSHDSFKYQFENFLLTISNYVCYLSPIKYQTNSFFQIINFLNNQFSSWLLWLVLFNWFSWTIRLKTNVALTHCPTNWNFMVQVFHFQNMEVKSFTKYFSWVLLCQLHLIWIFGNHEPAVSQHSYSTVQKAITMHVLKKQH
jgi:hypothetical protein